MPDRHVSHPFGGNGKVDQRFQGLGAHPWPGRRSGLTLAVTDSAVSYRIGPRLRGASTGLKGPAHITVINCAPDSSVTPMAPSGYDRHQRAATLYPTHLGVAGRLTSGFKVPPAGPWPARNSGLPLAVTDSAVSYRIRSQALSRHLRAGFPCRRCAATLYPTHSGVAGRLTSGFMPSVQGPGEFGFRASQS